MMLTLSGTVLNVYQAPQGVSKAGEAYGGGYKVQLQASNELKNGETRIELITLTAKEPGAFRDLMGKVVRVPVGVFASGNGVQFYITQNGRPTPEPGSPEAGFAGKGGPVL